MINQKMNDLFPCYSKDNKGLYISVNQDFLDISLISQVNDVIGFTDEVMPWHSSAQVLMENDARVIKTEKMQNYLEPSVYQGKPHIFRSTKSPLIGRHGKILGVQCISMPVSNASLIPLTHQQTACLKQLALGFTQKQTAELLGLAQKTVEHYLDAVKLKLNCKTRAELVMQAIERGLINI